MNSVSSIQIISVTGIEGVFSALMALHKGRQGKSKGTEQYLNMNMRRLRQPSHILHELTTEGTLKG